MKWSSITEGYAQDRKISVDELPSKNYDNRHRPWLNTVYAKMAWHEVYDLVEMVCDRQEGINIRDRWTAAQLRTRFNEIFETGLSGYSITRRFATRG